MVDQSSAISPIEAIDVFTVSQLHNGFGSSANTPVGFYIIDDGAAVLDDHATPRDVLGREHAVTVNWRWLDDQAIVGAKTDFMLMNPCRSPNPLAVRAAVTDLPRLSTRLCAVFDGIHRATDFRVVAVGDFDLRRYRAPSSIVDDDGEVWAAGLLVGNRVFPRGGHRAGPFRYTE